MSHSSTLMILLRTLKVQIHKYFGDLGAQKANQHDFNLTVNFKYAFLVVTFLILVFGFPKDPENVIRKDILKHEDHFNTTMIIKKCSSLVKASGNSDDTKIQSIP